jgi:AraC family transcriptional regulator, ethanolamine operon transcriptional activator
MRSDCQERIGASASRRAVVERAEAYVRAHLDTPIPLSQLCRLVGLSERGLRNAFYTVHGMGPKRWMVAERLLSAQIALREPRDVPITVTGVATDYGFYQLGRFAALYKQTFGEAPSQTLQSASRARDPSNTEHRREYGDAFSS